MAFAFMPDVSITYLTTTYKNKAYMCLIADKGLPIDCDSFMQTLDQVIKTDPIFIKIDWFIMIYKEFIW